MLPSRRCPSSDTSGGTESPQQCRLVMRSCSVRGYSSGRVVRRLNWLVRGLVCVLGVRDFSFFPVYMYVFIIDRVR